MAKKKNEEELETPEAEATEAEEAEELEGDEDVAAVEDPEADAGDEEEEEEDASLDPTSDEAGIPGDQISVTTGIAAAERRGQHRRKIRIGVVVGDAQDKTVTVEVQRQFAHPLYGKQVGRSKKYHVHDEGNEYQRGDVVQIVETRPISRTKRWRVEELIERPE